jgi:hypothetical protein
MTRTQRAVAGMNAAKRGRRERPDPPLAVLERMIEERYATIPLDGLADTSNPRGATSARCCRC